MPVLKQQEAISATREAIVLDLGDLRKQADALVAAARKRAEAIVLEAKQQADSLRAAAREEGRAEGHAAGHAEGLEAGREQGRVEAAEAWGQRHESACKSLNEATRQVEAEREALQRHAEEAVVRFAAQTARRIVHRVVETDREVVLRQVEAAMSHLLESHRVVLRVHPDDLDLVAEQLPTLRSGFEHLRVIDLETDATVDRGGCRLQAGVSRVDGRIGTQLERLVTAMLGDSGEPDEPAAAAPGEGGPEVRGGGGDRDGEEHGDGGA